MVSVPHPRAHRRPGQPTGVVQVLVRADLATFGERLTTLQRRLEGAVVAETVTARLWAAHDAHREAAARLREEGDVESVKAAVTALASGRQHLAQVEAYVAGDDAPEERVPCLFDPAHGPSVTDATWTSVRYGTRQVPACLRDAVLLAAGVPPDRRVVTVDGRQVAYFEAHPHVAPYLDAYFPDHPLLAWLRDPGNPLPRGVRRPPGVFGRANTFSPGV